MVKPVTTHEVAGAAAVQVWPPDEVTKYDTMSAPLPSAVNDGAETQKTCTDVSPRLPVTVVGASGTPAGITAPVAAEDTDEPAAF